MQVAIYLRVSTVKQSEEGYSIDSQRERLTNFAKSQKWEIVSEYEDAGESGRTINRPAFNQMLDDAKSNKFKTVLVYKLDRFSRSLQDLVNIINLLKTHNVYVWSVTQSYDERTPEGRLMRNMLGSFAQFESEMIGVRVKDGMNQRAKGGGWNTKAPFGYNMKDGVLVIHEKEAEIVKNMYSYYLQMRKKYCSMKKIAEHLNENYIYTKKGNIWNQTSVQRILKNPIYAGYIFLDKLTIQSNNEIIIDVKTYNKAQRKRGRNKKFRIIRKSQTHIGGS